MVDMLMVRAEAPPTLATMSLRARPMVPFARRPGPKPAITALMAIFSTEARPRLGGTNAIISLASRPDPATMAATRSRVGGTTGSPSVTPRSKRASKGSGGSGVTVASGPADAEIAVVALGHRLGVVGIGEHGDAGGFGGVRLLKELLVVLEDVDALLRPLPFLLRPPPHHHHLGQAGARREARAHGHHRAPDVLERLHRPWIVGKDGVDGHRAVVGLRLPFVRALGKLHGTPRPGEERVCLGVPLVLLAHLH